MDSLWVRDSLKNSLTQNRVTQSKAQIISKSVLHPTLCKNSYHVMKNHWELLVSRYIIFPNGVQETKGLRTELTKTSWSTGLWLEQH